ncbi:hypothetical protein [Streptomyces europaeiscabiei]|uniref:hypothetical protein n=1 Tax=Streptomyces europaeiscabiei TaxID=146819 RepID=UPI0029BC9BEA|nr:hypothetical protein [Streptomyces europaeiscabiei]MDX3617914.1 hypothetical protein [Streptomyces europaeiscabiei]
MDDEAVTIRLTHDQAFVLSDWLYQVMFRSDDLEGIIRDRAVWSPIHAISGTLDGTLTEIFMPDYTERLQAAQERLRFSMYGEPDVPAASSEDTATTPQAVVLGRDDTESRGDL